MAEKFLMKNESSGQLKQTFLGYSWTMLFFNAFAPLFRGDLRTFFTLIALNIAVILASPNIIFLYCVIFMPGFIYSFLWNKEYTKKLIEKGFVFAEDDNKNSYAITKYNTPNKPGYIFCGIYCVLSLLIAFQFVGIKNNSMIYELYSMLPYEFNNSLTTQEYSINKNTQQEIVAADNSSRLSEKQIIFDKCKRIDSVFPVICGKIPLNGYKNGDCISAMMDNFEQVCKKMKKGKKYKFEYEILNTNFEGDLCDPYENITKIYLK